MIFFVLFCFGNRLFLLRQTADDWDVRELPNGRRSPTNLNDPGGKK
jgi:hypothetical protein